MAHRDAIAEPWGTRAPYGPGDPWPVRVDRHLAPGVAPDDVQRWVRTASLLHSNGDAMDVAVVGGRIGGVRGRTEDRVNRGRLGPEDLSGWQANASPERLTRPLVREGGRLVETDTLITDACRCGCGPGSRSPCCSPSPWRCTSC